MKVFTTVVMFTVIVVITVTLSANDKVRELKLQQAIDLIESKGDLAKATPLLEDVARSADQGLAVRGLMYLAQAQERHGSAEALRTYRRIVDSFGSPNEAVPVSAVVSEARTKLAAMGQKGAGLVVRQISNTPPIGDGGIANVFPDGRSMAFTNADGNLAVYDLESGRTRVLTSIGNGNDDWAAYPMPSPDGRLVAYSWHLPARKHVEVRLIGRDGGASRVVYTHEAGTYSLELRGWTPDSKSILAYVYHDQGSSLLLVPVAGGTARRIKDFDGVQEIPWNSSLSPDGRFVAYDLRTTQDRPERDLFLLSIHDGREYAMRHPANDEMLEWFPEGDRILFTSDRGGTTAIWSARVAGGRISGEPTIIMPDVGQIRSQGFTRKKEFYYRKVVRPAEVYLASLDPATGKQVEAPTKLIGRFTDDMKEAAWSPDGDRLASVQSSESGLAIQKISTGVVNVVQVPLRYMSVPAWLPDGREVIVAATDLQGRQGLFRVNVVTGAVTPVATRDGASKDAARAHPMVSPDGRRVFFMQAGVIPGRPGAARSIAVRDLTSGAEEIVVNNVANNIEIRAFALSPDGRWLAFVRPGRQEAPHLFVLPVSGGEARPVSTAVSDWRIGPVSIAWSRDSRFVVVSKQLDNEGGSEIWQVPLDRSEPRNTGIRLPRGASRIDVSPDGRRLALSTQGVRTETWVLQNIPPQKK